MSSNAPYLHFFPGEARHSANGASFLGVQTRVKPDLLGDSYQEEKAWFDPACSAFLASLLQFPTSVTMYASLPICLLLIGPFPASLSNLC